MSLYGTAEASSPNLNYPFDEALAAARRLDQLTNELQSSTSSRATEETKAVVDWLGPSVTEFGNLVTATNNTSITAESTVTGLADAIAAQWAQARGQQDRINQARWVLDQKEHESGFRSTGFGKWLLGEKDYGSPPENPPVPKGPNYAATRDPIHPEFQ